MMCPEAQGSIEGDSTFQRIHRAVVALRIVVGHLHGFQLFEAGLLGDLVLASSASCSRCPHVGDVAHVTDLVPRSLEVAEQQVEGYGRTGMAQMRVPVDRRSADVHPDPSLDERLELLLAAGERIVNHKFGFHNFLRLSSF